MDSINIIKAKPVLRWAGGKRRLLKHILPLMRPHECYVEAFAGGLAVLGAKERSKIEVVNDLNGDVVRLYRCAQYHLNALLEELEWMVCSRENIREFLAQPGLTDLQRAARFLIRNRTSFGGGGSSFAVAKRSGGGAGVTREKLVALLRGLSERLSGVAVENATYERILKNYDAPGTLFFLDPPYVSADIGNYEPWDEARMVDFAERVKRLQGDWIVTVNDSELTRRLFQGHEILPIVTRSGTVNRRVHQGTFGELVIRRRMVSGIVLN
jgi:DNA adenine methylase